MLSSVLWDYLTSLSIDGTIIIITIIIIFIIIIIIHLFIYLFILLLLLWYKVFGGNFLWSAHTTLAFRSIPYVITILVEDILGNARDPVI